MNEGLMYAAMAFAAAFIVKSVWKIHREKKQPSPKPAEEGSAPAAAETERHEEAGKD